MSTNCFFCGGKWTNRKALQVFKALNACMPTHMNKHSCHTLALLYFCSSWWWHLNPKKLMEFFFKYVTRFSRWLRKLCSIYANSNTSQQSYIIALRGVIDWSNGHEKFIFWLLMPSLLWLLGGPILSCQLRRVHHCLLHRRRYTSALASIQSGEAFV